MPAKTKLRKSPVKKGQNQSKEEQKNLEDRDSQEDDENIATKTTAAITKSTTKSFTLSKQDVKPKRTRK